MFKVSIYFSLFDVDMQRTGTIRAIVKKGHIRIIPAMFGSLGDVI